MNYKEIKDLVRQVTAVVRKHGYRVDDETHSTIGLAIAMALNAWKGEGSFSNYAIQIALNEVSKLPKQDLSIEVLPPVLFHAKPDTAQRILMTLDPLTRDIAFSVWIEGKSLTVAAEIYGLTIWRVQRLLLATQALLISTLEDLP